MGYGTGHVSHSLILESFPEAKKPSASFHRGGVNMILDARTVPLFAG